MSTNDRNKQIETWVSETLDTSQFQMAPASSDASFRRYFRVSYMEAGESRTRIVMDAPPEVEDTVPFVNVAKIMVGLGLNVPLIFAEDKERGFLMLSDLGNEQYLQVLNENNVQSYYADAIDALLTLQEKGPTSLDSIPPYNHELLMNEMGLFTEWYVKTHRNVELDEEQIEQLSNTFERLAQSALDQPQVFVHRDYHSRNLMRTAQNNPGIIDFQDAVIGAVCYDLVSLLRDCYIAWPRQQVEQWAADYLSQCQQRGIVNKEVDHQQWLQWFDWMGVQRHLKATGIFARLYHRDGKPGYLDDIPRTLGYVKDVSGRYDGLSPLHDLIESFNIN